MQAAVPALINAMESETSLEVGGSPLDGPTHLPFAPIMNSCPFPPPFPHVQIQHPSPGQAEPLPALTSAHSPFSQSPLAKKVHTAEPDSGAKKAEGMLWLPGGPSPLPTPPAPLPPASQAWAPRCWPPGTSLQTQQLSALNSAAEMMDRGPKAGLALGRPMESFQLLSTDPSRVSAFPAASPVFWLPGEDVRGYRGCLRSKVLHWGSRTGRWAQAVLHLPGEQLRGNWGRWGGCGSGFRPHSLSMPWKSRSPVPFCVSTSFSKAKTSHSSPAMTSCILSALLGRQKGAQASKVDLII